MPRLPRLRPELSAKSPSVGAVGRVPHAPFGCACLGCALASAAWSPCFPCCCCSCLIHLGGRLLHPLQTWLSAQVHIPGLHEQGHHAFFSVVVAMAAPLPWCALSARRALATTKIPLACCRCFRRRRCQAGSAVAAAACSPVQPPAPAILAGPTPEGYCGNGGPTAMPRKNLQNGP